MIWMTCYKCNQRVTCKDKIVFVAGHPAHQDECPKRKKNGGENANRR